MHVTRYIRVWGLQKDVNTRWQELSGHCRACCLSPLFLSWMRCSLWTGKEREDSSLDPGPWAITETGKLGPSSLEQGEQHPESLKACPWWCSWSSFYRLLRNTWCLPSCSIFSDGTLGTSSWPCGNIYTIKVSKFRDFFPPQREGFFFLNTYQHTTALSLKVSPLSCVCVSLAALELRLKDGAHRCEGRVEAKYKGEWGTVYTEYWLIAGVEEVCRQLECGVAIDAPRGSYFGPRLGPIWFLYDSCESREDESTLTLYECVHVHFKNYNDTFSHDQDIGAVCSGKACLVWEGIPSRKHLCLIHRMTMRKPDHMF